MQQNLLQELTRKVKLDDVIELIMLNQDRSCNLPSMHTHFVSYLVFVDAIKKIKGQIAPQILAQMGLKSSQITVTPENLFLPVHVLQKR